MAITLTTASLTEVKGDGGYELIVEGSFTIGNRHRIHIGQNLATTADPACYSGKPGQGTIIYPHQEDKLRGYTPELDDSALLDDYDILVVDLDAPDSGALEEWLAVVPRDYDDRTFVLRQTLPPFYKTGARNMRALL